MMSPCIIPNIVNLDLLSLFFFSLIKLIKGLSVSFVSTLSFGFNDLLFCITSLYFIDFYILIFIILSSVYFGFY